LKIKDGDCIGAFTNDRVYYSRGSHIGGSGGAFLFNLSCFRYFPSKLKGKEMEFGSLFHFTGGDKDELRVWNNYCTSYENGSGYAIPIDKDGLNMLSNQKKERFEITEMEVWEV
jgi:hypothetical protein